jgi:hypothetical protein
MKSSIDWCDFYRNRTRNKNAQQTEKNAQKKANIIPRQKKSSCHLVLFVSIDFSHLLLLLVDVLVKLVDNIHGFEERGQWFETRGDIAQYSFETNPMEPNERLPNTFIHTCAFEKEHKTTDEKKEDTKRAAKVKFCIYYHQT